MNNQLQSKLQLSLRSSKTQKQKEDKPTGKMSAMGLRGEDENSNQYTTGKSPKQTVGNLTKKNLINQLNVNKSFADFKRDANR